MIRRPAGDDFWLITQDDHARFSGAIAGQLGANGFAPPTPRDAVIAAVAGHDAGWPLHDDLPTLNEQGRPLHVFEIPMALATRVWSASVERARGFDPYATLLVSLHQMALADAASRQGSGEHERAQSAGERFELNKFQHKQIEIQESLRRTLGLRADLPLKLGLAKPGSDPAEDELAFNFRLLRLCDQLSLQLCCGKLLFPEIEGVPPAPGREPVTVRTAFVDDRTVSATPWPFAVDRIEAAVHYRSVTAEPFTSEADFRSAYAASALQLVTFAIQPS